MADTETCCDCRLTVLRAECYFRDPTTGRPVQEAYCAECYERLSARAQWQEAKANHTARHKTITMENRLMDGSNVLGHG